MPIQTTPIQMILHNSNYIHSRVDPDHLSIWLKRGARAHQFSANDSLFISLLMFNVNKLNSSIKIFLDILTTIAKGLLAFAFVW